MNPTTTPAAANETAAALAAWAERTLGTAAPADRHAQQTEWYDPATIPADVYRRSLAWLARRYVRDMTSATPAAPTRKAKTAAAATLASIRARIQAETKPRTGGNDHQGLSYAELIARSHDAAADYYHGAIVRLSAATIKRGETVARTGWQRSNVGAHDHARAAIVVAQQARRARWRTAETETGGGRTTGRRRFPYVHGMSATGDNPAAVAALMESYARDGRRSTAHQTGPGRRRIVTSPAPDTPYRIAQAEALAALMGNDQTESMTAPKIAHTTAGGTCQHVTTTMIRTTDGTATITDIDHIGPDTMPCLVNGKWQRVQTGWTAYTRTRTVPRHHFTMSETGKNAAAYDPATVNDVDHAGEIIAACVDWNPTRFPAAPAVPALTIMEGKLFQGTTGTRWYTIGGEIVNTTHRPRPANATPTADTMADYKAVQAYLRTVPTQTYKDWNDTAVSRIGEAFRESMATQAAREERHDAAR